MASAQLLCDVGLGSCDASSVSWCPVNGVVAVGARLAPDLACVHLVNVNCVSRKVTLYVPLEGPEDQLLRVAWSPASCRRVLLTATLFGKLTAWSQQPPDGSTPSHVTLEDWWSQDISHLGHITAEQAPATAVGSRHQPANSHRQVVQVCWLLPRPAWVWNPQVSADCKSGSLVDAFAAARSDSSDSSNNPAAQGTIKAEPGTVDASEELMFHWVRPGMLALAAVLSGGAVVLCWACWSAYGQLQWQATADMQLSTENAAVQAADAAVCSRGVAVCFTLQQEPSAIRVVLLEGNLQHVTWSMTGSPEQVQLPVSQLVHHQLAASPGSSVETLSWDPCSNGTRLASIVSSSSSGSGSGSHLQLLKLQGGLLVQAGEASCPASPHQHQLTWQLDTLLLSSGGQQLTLYQMEPLQQLATCFQQPGLHYHAAPGSSVRVRQALSASPHCVAVAAVVVSRSARPSNSSSSSSRLLIYNLPAVTAGMSAAQAAAGRVMWGLVQQSHCWDLVQHVLCAAQCPSSSKAVLREQFVSEVLGLVDDKLAVQQLTLKSSFSVRWDTVKLAVLSNTPGSFARTVSIDLRLRIISQVLRPVFDVLREEAGIRTREQQQRVKLPGLAPLHSCVSDMLAFHLACIKTWAVRRAGRDPDGGDPLLVPCVRHFLDWRPCNVLLLLYMISNNLVTGSKDEQLYSALKYAMKAAQMPATKDPNWEQSVKALLPGPFYLHYGDAIPECLASFSLPPEQLLRYLEANTFWQNQQTLSDADIAAAATRLGLLPARSAASINAYRHELQLHGGFRRELQADTALQETAAAAAAASAGQGLGRVGSMKRRQWQLMLGDAMGDVHGPGSSSSSHVIDLAHMSELDVRVPGVLQSVDGTVLTHDSMPVLDDSKALPKGITEQFQHGWVYACPISGEMWMRS